MYHSIFIEPSNGDTTYNTYDTFHLMSDGRPLIEPPEVKSTFVDIPGADGALDYTEALNGINYKNRKGSWNFYVMNNYQSIGVEGEKDWASIYSLLMKKIHGRHFDKIWLEDETQEDGKTPTYYYKGRLFVNSWKSDPQYSKVVVNYELEPYKYPEQTTERPDWLWADLFGSGSVNPIMYGKFTVSGTKDRTIITSSDTVGAYCTTSMTVSFYDGSPSVVLPSGTSEFQHAAGEYRVTFTGAGQVTLYYGEGRML